MSDTKTLVTNAAKPKFVQPKQPSIRLKLMVMSLSIIGTLSGWGYLAYAQNQKDIEKAQALVDTALSNLVAQSDTLQSQMNDVALDSADEVVPESPLDTPTSMAGGIQPFKTQKVQFQKDKNQLQVVVTQPVSKRATAVKLKPTVKAKPAKQAANASAARQRPRIRTRSS
ncbi:MAG: hypothetical protein ACRCV6_04475 [Formosimonas sp.]